MRTIAALRTSEHLMLSEGGQVALKGSRFGGLPSKEAWKPRSKVVTAGISLSLRA